MIHVVITYHATGVRASVTLGNDNFTYWVYQKIEHSRWRKEDNKFSVDDLTDEEADYLEQLAQAQSETGDQVRLEVRGKPVSMGGTVKKRPVVETPQMSLF